MSDVILPPPGDALEMFLYAAVPAGARTWATIVADMPWIKPPRGLKPKPTCAQLHRLLIELGVVQQPVREWILAGAFSALMVHSPRELDRNHGRPARSIAVAAAELDIRGRDPIEISDALDLTDYRIPTPRAAAESMGDLRSLRRYRAEGRRLLAGIGVWPWATYGDGRLPRRWWTDPIAASAFEQWRFRTWRQAVLRLGRGELVARGRAVPRALSIGEVDAAEGYRAALAAIKFKPAP